MSRKRIGIGLFFLIWLLILGNTSVCFAVETEDGFTYTESNGVVTITAYSGLSTVDIGASFPDATEIVIGEWAFENSNVVNVTIPKNVMAINASAFNGCTSLQTVTFEERTTESLALGERAFYDCDALVSLDIPDTVTTIPSYFVAFSDALERVDLPSGCVSIGNHAFDSCDALKSITIPASCNTISADAFRDCDGLVSVTFEDRTDITEEFVLGESAFAFCEALTSITLPDNCKTVAYHAFSSCTSLATVILPDGCESVGATAFYGCSALTSVTLPDTCKSIGDSAFWGCSALSQMNSEEAGKVVLPAGCRAIGEQAFSGCTSIVKLYIPESCTSLGYMAFNGCTGITVISVENPEMGIGTSALPTSNASTITVYCNGAGTVFTYYEQNNVAIIPVNTSSLTLTITQFPTKTEYYYGESKSLDFSGIELVAEKNDDNGTTTTEVDIKACLISGFQSETVGEQTITISYGGNTATFKVNVYYNLANAAVEVDNVTYTGVRVQPYMTVTGNETETALVVNRDYVVSYENNLNAGTATAIISGIGNYKGDKKVDFKVLPKEITEANTTVVVADMEYTGEQLRPVPGVTCGTEPLILDEDYVLTYGTNVNVGKGFVIVEGIGNYDGSIKKWFAINEVSESDDSNTGTGNGGNVDTDTDNNTGSNTDGSSGDANPGKTDSTEQTTTSETPQKGKTYTYKNMYYKVTGSSTVTFMKSVNKKIKKISIPSKVKILGKTFKVTKINKKACYNCKKLTTVTIGNNVTSIDDQAFAKCGKLEKVTIGKGLKKIGKKAFYKDKKLEKLIIKSSKLTSVGKQTLRGCKGVKIYAPKKKVEKYSKLFRKAK